MIGRWGLRIFQMTVRGRPVLIYAGHSVMDVDRYIVSEAGRAVYKFQGDVLAAVNSDISVARATANQIEAWGSAFKQAVSVGDADRRNPAAFALALDPAPHRPI